MSSMMLLNLLWGRFANPWALGSSRSFKCHFAPREWRMESQEPYLYEGNTLIIRVCLSYSFAESSLYIWRHVRRLAKLFCTFMSDSGQRTVSKCSINDISRVEDALEIDSKCFQTGFCLSFITYGRPLENKHIPISCREALEAADLYLLVCGPWFDEWRGNLLL